MTRRRFLRRYPSIWYFILPGPGRLLLIAVTLSGMIGSVTTAIPMYHLFFALSALMAVSFLGAVIFRPRVAIRGNFPDRISAGETVTTYFVVENLSRIPVYDLTLRLFGLPTYIRQTNTGDVFRFLGGRRSAAVPAAIRIERRGVHVLPDLVVSTVFPFRLFRMHGARLPGDTVLALPRFTPLRRMDIPFSRRYQPASSVLMSHTGESPEYMGNREYRPGDPARRIDFRAWARLTVPVIREYQEEYYCRLGLVLDTSTAPRRAGLRGRTDFEAAVSLCAAVADILARDEHIVDIFAAGPQLHVFRAGRSLAHTSNILEILACLTMTRRDTLNLVAPALSAEAENLTSVVCILLDWDRSREEFVRRITEQGSTVKVIVISSGRTTVPLPPSRESPASFLRIPSQDVREGRVESL